MEREHHSPLPYQTYVLHRAVISALIPHLQSNQPVQHWTCQPGPARVPDCRSLAAIRWRIFPARIYALSRYPSQYGDGYSPLPLWHATDYRVRVAEPLSAGLQVLQYARRAGQRRLPPQFPLPYAALVPDLTHLRLARWASYVLYYS